MAIDFPNSPSNGTTHTHNGKTWTYNGENWVSNPSSSGSSSYTIMGEKIEYS